MPAELPIAADEPQRLALFPERLGFCGPVTAMRMLRLFFIYIVILLAGLYLALADVQASWQIFGLGLMLPGGGFLAHAGATWSGLMHIAIALAGMLAFAGALVVWFATGNVLAPPAVWLLLAIAATNMQHGYVHPTAVGFVLGIIGLMAAAGLLSAIVLKRLGDAKRRRANAWLIEYGADVVRTFSKSSGAAAEFSLDDLKRMRFLLDRALQPVNEFNGFEWLDQYQTAAVRYQLNFLGYALSMAQATHLPAFKGYLSEAQRCLILKQTDYRVWRYWTAENLWGNLRYNPDPVAHENIMFTGFCATQMAMYQNASGSDEFSKPASFALKHPSGAVYSYSQPGLIAALEREANRSDFHLIACEPNWIYPLCNTIGVAAVKSHAPEVWGRQESTFRHKLDSEFLDAAGRIVPCRSNYAGFAFPSIGGAMPQAMPSFFMNATMPDIAMRQWLVLRQEISRDDTLLRKKFWRIDTGNYRFTRASAYAATALAAAELGDDKVKQLCLKALDDECPTVANGNHLHRPKASVWAHAVEFLARATLPGSFSKLMNNPVIHEGPYLALASYPDVLVAAARYESGELQLVLYPGDKPSRQSLTIAGLLPGQEYIIVGAEEQSLIANEQASAIIHVNLVGRTDVRLSRKG